MKTHLIKASWVGIKPAHVANLVAMGVAFLGIHVGTNTCLAEAPPLKVGINPEYPPLVFRQPEGTNGAEIDFAHALGKELNRPIEFVVLNRDELIPALRDGRINIIMSGMSVTKARQLRVGFSQPYVHNQIRAIFPIQASASFKTPSDLTSSTARVGVVPGTTGEIWVKQNCRQAQIVPVTMRRDAAFFLLKGNRVDVFVDDTFALADILSQHESDISYMKQPMAEEDLAWGCVPGDELLPKVNAILDKWKSDGTLDGILQRWMPYLKKLSSPKSTE